MSVATWLATQGLRVLANHVDQTVEVSTNAGASWTVRADALLEVAAASGAHDDQRAQDVIAQEATLSEPDTDTVLAHGALVRLSTTPAVEWAVWGAGIIEAGQRRYRLTLTRRQRLGANRGQMGR